MTGLQIYTGTYQRFARRLGVPIRTTVGAPRFQLAYELAGHWKTVTPDWAMVRGKLSEADFRGMYRAKLDAAGLDRIMAEAEAFVQANGDNRLVALCFDDLTKPGQWCHRSMLGEWLTDHGVPVIELFSGRDTHQPDGTPKQRPEQLTI